ncbi:VanZ family protein [Cellvibrio sp.]|jgi:polysaccharide biosynthesis protein VpsQ
MSFLNYCRQPLCIAFSVFFGFILWIIYEADRGADNIFMSAADSIPYGDKLGHVWLYGGLALLLNLLLNRRVMLIKSVRFQLGSLLVFGFAAAEELSQGFFATRSMDGWDLLADLLGVCIAAFLVNTKKGEY